MTLKTRQPTGTVPWPLILLEGGEKCGKSYAAALLTACKLVGRCLWLDLAEGAADEYGAIPGARYEVIVHDGTWPSIMGQVKDAKDAAIAARAASEPPMVLIVDNGSIEWDMQKDWASSRARKTKSNEAKLARDPNAEITVPMNCWNDAAARHHQFMTALMTFPGIVVIIARGGEVAAVEGGKPVEGKKTYRVEGHKSLAFDATCWVRLSRDAKPVVVGARSVHAGIRPGIDPPQTLADDWSLEWLIFEALKCDPQTAHVRDLVDLRPEGRTPEEIRDEALETTTTPERLIELRDEARHAGYQEVTLDNESGDEELLLTMLGRFYRERGGRPLNGAPQRNGTARPASNGHGPGNGNGSRPQRQQRPAAQAHSTPDGTAAKGARRDVPSEEDFVRDFYERLADAAEPAGLAPFRREVIQAETDGVLSRENVTVLNQSVNKRARELATAGATA